MDKNAIEKKVCGLIAAHLCIDLGKVTLNARICDDLGGDALDTQELVLVLEEEFDIDLSEAVDGTRTVRQFAELVEAEVAKKPPVDRCPHCGREAGA